MKRLFFSSVVLSVWPLACGGDVPEPKCPKPEVHAPKVDKGVASEKPVTVEDAEKFMEKTEADLRKLWVMRDRAGWISQNFITDDTEALAAEGEEATASYMTRAIQASAKFKDLKLPDELSRKFLLLRLAQTVPAPSTEPEAKELAEIESGLTSAYGKGRYCPKTGPLAAKDGKGGERCYRLDDLSKILEESRDYETLLDAWKGWHTISRPMREKYARYVELGNKGAREIGFSDMGALWRAGYDMPPEAFEADIERLWSEVKPLYDALHCYARARLRKHYGESKVPKTGPIPAHLLGNMWAQEWADVYPLMEPYKGEPSLDVTRALVKKKVDALSMVRMGEDFFKSLGFDPLPESFWKRSLFVRPQDREVVCHASAWDVTWQNDLRIKMCIKPTENDFITIHHELGHDYYFQRYYKLPILFQAGANDGFHEGIGDTLALSVTPEYLKAKGLLDKVPNNEKAKINLRLKQALDKIAFLPFGLLIDKWRWDVFSGKVGPGEYNAAWWKLREKYQGVSRPAPAGSDDFDPGAKFHVPASTPYIRYFLARIYQFQFHRALCKAAGHKGPLDTCSIYGNKEAGSRLIKMLSYGASRPWPEALAALGAETRADATAILEYFAPLTEWLKEQNRGETCGF